MTFKDAATKEVLEHLMGLPRGEFSKEWNTLEENIKERIRCMQRSNTWPRPAEKPFKCRGVIYLACPYSHPDPTIRQQRVDAATLKAAQLMQDGFVVFSPLTHSHPIALTGLVDGLDCDLWLRQDLMFMKVCDEVHVLMLLGWRESIGVGHELQEARALGIPIIMEPTEVADI